MRRICLAITLALAFLGLATQSSRAQDTTPPSLVWAERWDTNLYQIHVNFSERLTNSAISNLDNFIITGVRTGSANAKTYTNDVTDAVWFGTSRSNIVLTLAQPAEHGSNFVLRVTGIQDIAGNTLADGVVQVASVDRQLAIDGTDNNYWAYWDSM